MEEKIMSLVNITKELTNKEEGMNAAETSQCLDSYEELVTILMSERANYKGGLKHMPQRRMRKSRRSRKRLNSTSAGGNKIARHSSMPPEVALS